MKETPPVSFVLLPLLCPLWVDCARIYRGTLDPPGSADHAYHVELVLEDPSKSDDPDRRRIPLCGGTLLSNRKHSI